MKMTPSEFRTARERLGWTQAQAASELAVAPDEIARWESGDRRVPRDPAELLRCRVFDEDRRVVLEASGLPECPVAAGLERTMEGKQDDALSELLDRHYVHRKSCSVCRARVEYLERHGPPMPKLSLGLLVRAMELLEAVNERLPRPIRPPDGKAGDGRRAGLFMGAFLSAFVTSLLAVVGVLWLIVRGGTAGWWRGPLTILGVMVPAYLVGAYLAGAAFDATRRIRHRFVGYVIRGALAATGIYGTIGMAMPFLDAEISYSDVPIITGMFAAIGAIGGGVLWVWHRMMDKLPTPIT